MLFLRPQAAALNGGVGWWQSARERGCSTAGEISEIIRGNDVVSLRRWWREKCPVYVVVGRLG